MNVPRTVQLSLGASLFLLVAAAAMAAGKPPPTEASVDASDTCFSYGRVECCYRPEEP